MRLNPRDFSLRLNRIFLSPALERASERLAWSLVVGLVLRRGWWCYTSSFLKTSVTLWPPKPKELDKATLTGMARASLGT